MNFQNATRSLGGYLGEPTTAACRGRRDQSEVRRETRVTLGGGGGGGAGQDAKSSRNKILAEDIKVVIGSLPSSGNVSGDANVYFFLQKL